MFTPKSKIGRCASCDAEMSGYSTVVETTSGNAEYALMDGTWVYTQLQGGKAVKKVFVDVEESKDSSNIKTTSEWVVVSDFDENSGWSTEAGVDKNGTTYSATTGVRALQVAIDATTYKISEENGKYTLKDASGNDLLKNNTGTISFKDGHHHQYAVATGDAKTTDGSATNAKSVWADSNFAKMTFLGQNLMDEDNHYVYCSDCGITNYPVSHLKSDYTTIGADGVCSCGYTKNTDSTKGNIYSPVYIYPVEAKLKFAGYDTILTLLGTMNTDAVTGTSEDTANAATEKAREILANSKIAYETAGETYEGSKLEKLTTSNTTLASAVSTNASNASSLATAISGLKTTITNYGWGDEDDVVKAIKELNDLETEEARDLSNTDICNAVDKLAKEIAKAAKTIAKEAGETAKTGAVNNAESLELDHFVVVKGTVLKLDYASYTTSGGNALTFANDSGWTAIGNGIALTANGYRVSGDAFLFCPVR